MEGVGSRIVRASSRYGSISAGPSFKGPVRKWKRGWVLSQPDELPAAGKGSHRWKHQQPPESNQPPLFLCRWTRLSGQPEPAAKRKFRYTPVVVFEEKKKREAKGVEVKEFKPVTEEDILMNSEDADDFDEELEDREFLKNLMRSRKALYY